MGRAPCCDKANVKKGPWSPEEDAKLKEFIDKYGTGGNWIALPHKAGLKRCGKSCRLRWLNYLRPNIKHGEFSDDEDRIICTLFATIGSRWSIIAAQLPGRTDNDIKNYWNTKLKKKLLGISSSQRKQHNHHHQQQQQSQQQQQPLQPQLSSRTTGGHEVFPHSSSTDILINSVHQVHESPFGVPMMHHNNLLMFGGDQQSCSSSECNSNQISYGSKDVDLEGCYNLYSGIGENQRLLLYGGASEIERSNGFFGEAPLEFGFEDIKPMVFNNNNNNNNNGFFIEDQTTSMVRGDRNQGRFMYYC